MKLYPKQLNSLKELKREKKNLRNSLKETDDLFDGEVSGAQSDDAATAGLIGAIISAFGSSSFFNTILAIAPTIINIFSKRPGKKKKNPVESLAKELIFGYIKWRAVLFGYNTLMSFFGTKKDKKDGDQ